MNIYTSHAHPLEPDYQTGLLWYEKQASRGQQRGYVSKDKLSQN